MRIRSLLAALFLLTCSITTLADTRVEFLGRAADNGFAYYSPQTPWSGARVGEYFYTSFVVTGPGIDITQPQDHQIQPLVEANVFNIVPGTMMARLSDVEMAIPVAFVTDPIIGPVTNPAALLAHYYYQVDTFDMEGVFIPWALGSCCFPGGSCQVINHAQCARGAAPGVWTSSGVCDPSPCPQPTGACCAFDDSCSITTLASCSGFWITGGVCTPGVTCPQSPGSCCSSNGACSVTIESQCSGSGLAWTSGAACVPNPCQTLLIPGYAMSMYLSYFIPRIPNPPVAWPTADFASITGTYPGSLFNNSRSWLVSFVGTDHLSYEMFIDVQKMVISTDTTATGSCCPGDGHCFVGTQAICPAGAQWTSGGTCASSPCPTAAGACCYANGTCDLVTPGVCAAVANAVYQGDGTSCATSSCGATGACCAAGSCSVILQSACLSSGGSWLGAGTACATLPQNSMAFSLTAGSCCQGNICSIYPDQYQCGTGTWRPATTCLANICGGNGACCNNSTGVCSMATNVNGCGGGTWTPGTPCSPSPCPSVGACCNITDGTCSVQIQTTCLSASGGTHTWSSVGTCATFCSAGACCNNTFATCSVLTQSACTGTWTPGIACEAPCTVPIAFIHGPATTPQEFTITPTASGTVSEVEVFLTIEMGRIADLDIQLVAPNGVAVDLMNRVGASNCTGNFVGASAQMYGSYVFLDSAPQSIAAYLGAQTIAAPPGSYKPAGCTGTPVSLNTTFAGLSIAGNWKLRLTNYRTNIYGYLTSWGISFNGGNPAPCTIGHCNLPQGGCTASTFAQCSGSWSIGPCTPTSCTSGTPGACCYLNTCSVICQALCPSNANGGRFAGFGTTCTASVCNVACCLSTGVCTVATTANCAGAAGAIGSACSPNTCAQPAACCQPGGACAIALPATCGGTVGSATCTPNTCPGQFPAPPNDLCSTVFTGGGGTTSEIVLSNGTATINDTLVGATSDGVFPSCGQAANDVWYRFTPPSTTTYLIKTCNSSLTWDSLVSVWSSCTMQIPGACGDTGCSSSNHASLTFPLTAGTPYLIRVSAFSAATPNIDTFRLFVGGQGACCIRNSACYTGTCVITDPSSCSGVHQGLGSTCSPLPCPQELGACCRPDNACSSTCETGCQSQGGTFDGIGSVCGPNPCPIGLCCRGATCNTTVSFVACLGDNAAYLGAVPQCNAPGITSTPCCYADFDKLNGISVQDIFAFLNAWFAGSPYALTGGNGDTGTLTVQNIFDFLNAWFSGGC